MAFSQATITDGPNCSADGRDLLVEWTSSSAFGTVFQVYVNGSLAWAGTARSAHLPMPTAPSYVQVGTVGPGEDDTDFSGSLPALPGAGNRATLSWTGGRFLGSDLQEFRIYSGTAPGGAVSYASPVATVPAGPAGLWVDGYGIGGYGSGGYGYSAITYSWTSGRLAAGTWNFGIKAVDAAGNESAAATVGVTITAPPRPPAADATGRRLGYTYNPGTRVPTLTWNAAPN